MIAGFGDPFDALFALQRSLESRLASEWLRDATAGSGSYPPVNVFQQNDHLVVVIELPGVDKADLQIQAKGNAIRISGKKAVNYDKAVSIHRRERVSGAFDRTLSVPIQIDPNAVRAEYRDGILAIFVPRADSDKPRAIQIS